MYYVGTDLHRKTVSLCIVVKRGTERVVDKPRTSHCSGVIDTCATEPPTKRTVPSPSARQNGWTSRSRITWVASARGCRVGAEPQTGGLVQ
jgi:hypothetical protein